MFAYNGPWDGATGPACLKICFLSKHANKNAYLACKESHAWKPRDSEF